MFLPGRYPRQRQPWFAQRPKSNMLLITFDALSAEDMSLYGYKLPTTPNLDAFARKATVFTNFYSACTFTTPSVATILTGTYPSESHVYQLQGHVRGEYAGKSFPLAMRSAGYATGAFVSNLNAYDLAQNLENGYDFLPEPIFQEGGLQYLWDATTPLHQDSGIGSRLDEYTDLTRVWNDIGRLPPDLYHRFQAASSFQHARELLAKLPDGFFLWVHVMTPHAPYLPDAADRGRFVPDDQPQTFEDDSVGRWKPHYEPDQQSQVDRHRLLYDEFVATADRAFGAFMSELENSGKLRDTTVIVSADHGESFEGGIYRHESPYQTRPVIHVPLIIRTPGQQDGRKVAFTADQTTLAPTILELAGRAETRLDARPIAGAVAESRRPGRRRGTGVLPVSGEEQRLQAPSPRNGRRDRRQVPVPIRLGHRYPEGFVETAQGSPDLEPRPQRRKSCAG